MPRRGVGISGALEGESLYHHRETYAVIPLLRGKPGREGKRVVTRPYIQQAGYGRFESEKGRGTQGSQAGKEKIEPRKQRITGAFATHGPREGFVEKVKISTPHDSIRLRCYQWSLRERAVGWGYIYSWIYS